MKRILKLSVYVCSLGLSMCLSGTISAQNTWLWRPTGFRIDLFAGFPTNDGFDDYSNPSRIESMRFPDFGFALGANVPVYDKFYVNGSVKVVALTQGMRYDIDLSKYPDLGLKSHIQDKMLNLIPGIGPHLSVGRWFQRNRGFLFAELGMSWNFFPDGYTTFGSYIAVDTTNAPSGTKPNFLFLSSQYETSLLNDLYRPSFEFNFGKLWLSGERCAFQAGLHINASQGVIARGAYAILPNTKYEQRGKITLGGSYIGAYASFVLHKSRGRRIVTDIE